MPSFCERISVLELQDTFCHATYYVVNKLLLFTRNEKNAILHERRSHVLDYRVGYNTWCVVSCYEADVLVCEKKYLQQVESRRNSKK